MKKAICIECGKEFEKNNNSHKRCSKCGYEKKIEYRKNYKRKENLIERSKKRYSNLKEKKLCPNCGVNEPCKTGYGTQIFCEDCHRKTLLNNRKYARVRENRFEIKNCLVCGKDITDLPSVAKYCLDCRHKLAKLWYKKGIRVKEAIEILKK